MNLLLKSPYRVGHLVGFKDLTELHNTWIRSMVLSDEDVTLQGHRGSYKTTCLSIALAVIMVLMPKKHCGFFRKTDDDVKEIIRQVANIIKNEKFAYIVKSIYGIDVALTTESATEISTNLSSDVKGGSQLVGYGIGASITGKHFDIIFTDDIVNLKDRQSHAERERTKTAYQELQNVKNRGGRFFNTGTPWHKDDAFSIMPPAKKYDCYSTGLISKKEIEEIKSKMTASLFAANYELRHIASDDVIFDSPQTGYNPALAEQGLTHIDAAYGGEDYTALTICHRVVEDGKELFYVYGRLWRKHIDDVTEEVINCKNRLNAGRIFVEDNGDKGYLAKDLKSRKQNVETYHENMNKFIKITSYLKSVWKQVRFVAGTDPEYIEQICDYTEFAEHDDAPDSLASIIRKITEKKEKVKVHSKSLLGLG